LHLELTTPANFPLEYGGLVVGMIKEKMLVTYGNWNMIASSEMPANSKVEKRIHYSWYLIQNIKIKHSYK
jgi:hypothetical protein